MVHVISWRMFGDKNGEIKVLFHWCCSSTGLLMISPGRQVISETAELRLHWGIEWLLPVEHGGKNDVKSNLSSQRAHPFPWAARPREAPLSSFSRRYKDSAAGKPGGMLTRSCDGAVSPQYDLNDTFKDGYQEHNNSLWQRLFGRGFLKSSPDRLFPLAAHPHHTVGQHAGLRSRHQVPTLAHQSHQLFCHLAGCVRPLGSHFGDALEGGERDRRFLAIRFLLRHLGGLWHHVLYSFHSQPLRD